MKRRLLLILPLLLLVLVFGCATGKKKHHKTDMPDPKTYNAHFGDIDADGDELVKWKEFDAYFENAEQKVFKAIDLNQDGNIDHDEWHEFKEAHGLKHIE